MLQDSGENTDVVCKVGTQHVPAAMTALDQFLRDHRTGDREEYHVRDFDLLHDLMEKVGKPEGEIDIVCGYRPPGATTIFVSMVMTLRCIASTWKPRRSTFVFRA